VLEFNEAPSHDITIQGINFPARQIFDEGHELSAVEASVLNQTRDENLRNNYAAKIKAAMKEEGVDDVSKLSAETRKQLIEKFPDFEEGYEFGSRGGAREADPVRKQAMLFATESVKTALQKKGYKIADVGPEKIRELASNAVSEHPKFLEKAAIAVAARDEARKDLAIDIG